MRCSVVWLGVAWCGLVWLGVVWCGVVWHFVACVFSFVQTLTPHQTLNFRFAFFATLTFDILLSNTHVVVIDMLLLFLLLLLLLLLLLFMVQKFSR